MAPTSASPLAFSRPLVQVSPPASSLTIRSPIASRISLFVPTPTDSRCSSSPARCVNCNSRARLVFPQTNQRHAVSSSSVSVRHQPLFNRSPTPLRHVSSSSQLTSVSCAAADADASGAAAKGGSEVEKGTMTDRGNDKVVANDDDADVIMAPDVRLAPELAYILPPPPEDQPTPDTTSPSPSSPPYLLLVAPGGFIPALSYLPVIRAIRSAAPSSLRTRLWVAHLARVCAGTQHRIISYDSSGAREMPGAHQHWSLTQQPRDLLPAIPKAHAHHSR
ncbi:unnamed protein product [Closterium sp. NIES-53]